MSSKYKISVWLRERLSEKSTITAFIGLLTVLLHYTKLPIDVIQAVTGFLAVLLGASAITKG